MKTTYRIETRHPWQKRWSCVPENNGVTLQYAQKEWKYNKQFPGMVSRIVQVKEIVVQKPVVSRQFRIQRKKFIKIDNES